MTNRELLIAQRTFKNKFNIYDKVVDKKDRKFIIEVLPCLTQRLAGTDESFYTYRDIKTNNYWVMPKDEFEKKFKLVE